MIDSTIRVVIPVSSTKPAVACVGALVESSIRSEIEIVVVSDGVAEDELSEALSPYEVKFVNAATARNAGVARNQGARGFGGDILVFLDSDVIVEKQSLEKLVACIRNGEADAVVGTYSHNVDCLNFWEAYKQLYVSNAYSRRRGYLYGEFWTALSAIRNCVFRELNGFSTMFAGATGEDTELGHRLSRLGYRVLAVPEAKGRHLKRLDFVALVQNDFRKGIKSFHLLLTNKGRVTDFRHSTSRDIAAVVAAYLVPGVALLWSWLPLWLMLVASSCYLAARCDLLVVYRKKGAGFLLKSIPVMYLLDLVRGLCVPLGFWQLWKERLVSSFGRTWSSQRL